MSTAVILAGGKSSRMGYDKQKLIVNHEAIIHHHIRVLDKLFDQILIISNNHNSDEYLNHEKVTIYPDILIGYGPLGGIHSALSHSFDQQVFVVACDMPNLDVEYIKHMLSICDNYDAVVTCYGDWIEPFHGFYSKNLIQDIEKYLMTGKKNISGFLERHNTHYVDEIIARTYTPDWSLFDNINTTKDLMINEKSKDA